MFLQEAKLPKTKPTLPLLGLSLVLGVALDVVLLWHGRWQTTTRLAYIGSNIFSLALLGLLIRGHRAWLSAEGVNDIFPNGEAWAQAINNTEQLSAVAMSGFLILFVMIAIIVLIDTIVNIFKLVRRTSQTNSSVKGIGLVMPN